MGELTVRNDRTDLVWLAEACQAIARAKDPEVVLEARERAEAILHYRKRRDYGINAINDAAEIKIRAERRLGELLREKVRHGGGRPKKQSSRSTVLPEGVTKNDSSSWQMIAGIPKAKFESYVTTARDGGKKLHTNALLKLAERKARRVRKHKEMKAKAQKARAKRAKAGTEGQRSANGQPEWDVRCGDCLELFREPLVAPGSARLVFADPPYNIGIDYGAGAKADSLPDDVYMKWVKSWLDLCRDALAPDGSLWVLIGDEYAAEYGVAIKAAGFTVRNWVKWYETFGVNCQDKFNRCSRHLFYCVKGPARFVFHREAVNRPSDRQAEYDDARADPDGKNWDDVWGVNPELPRVVGTARERLPWFPTQLPEALLTPIVLCATDPGDLVVDPFSGSATSGVVAVRHGRRYLGIEKSKRYVKLSRLRLEGVDAHEETC
jgi:site-specific DNA-methyltransferase (adenine-specific)